jgi:hypothetical protein
MSVVEKRREGAKLRYEQLMAERQSAATANAVSFGPNSRRQLDLDEERSQASQEFLATQSELGGRPPNMKLKSPLVFWTIAAIICLVEAMFNRVVVEMASPVPGPMAFLIAALLSASLMYCAHIMGALTRQVWSEIHRTIYPMNILIALACLVLDIVGIVGIVLLRVYFATAELSDDITIFDTANTVVRMGFELLAKLPTDPDAILLGGINVLALIVAMFLGALSHDSERQYDEHYRTLRDATAAARRAVSKYERRQHALYRRYRRRLGNAMRSYVGNGGAMSDLPKDDFKAQRIEAERASSGVDGQPTVLKMAPVRGSAA